MSWTSTVVCAHRAALGRAETLATWADGACSDAGCAVPAERVGRWHLGLVTSAAGEQQLREALADLADLDLPIWSALAALTREVSLPRCSVLVGDGERLAALAWGYPLHLGSLGRWEYSVTSVPGPDTELLAPGTLLALEDCGPTLMTFPLDQPSCTG